MRPHVTFRPCAQCGSNDQKGFAKGLCRRCYLAAYKLAHKDDPKPTCSRCGERPAHARGLCPSCIGKEYWQRYPERREANNRAYKAAHGEQMRAYAAQYRLKHREKYKAMIAAWRLAHVQYRREKGRAYYAAHRSSTVARHRTYYRENAHRWREYSVDNGVKRRLRILDGFVAKVSRAWIYKRDRGTCHICGGHVDPKHASIDHLLPVSRGGTHGPANVQLAHLLCNIRRGNRGPAQLRLLD